MKIVSILAGATLAAGFAVTSANATPRLGPGNGPEIPSLVEQAKSYRYHKSCYWTGTGWGYKHGGKIHVCRPYKPRGHGWIWYNEGPRHGWYHSKNKHWHHKW